MHRRQQVKEQFHVGDIMDPRDFDHRLMLTHSYKVLSTSPESLWSTVMSRSLGPSSTQSVTSPDVIDIDEGFCITNALQEHALALHQMTLIQGVFYPSDPWCLNPLMSPGGRSGTHPSSSFLRNSSRSAYVFTPTFITNQGIWILQPVSRVKVQRSNTNLEILDWVLS